MNAPGAERRCPRCGAAFRCGIDDSCGCWCARDFPPLPPEPGIAGCLCPRCLAERVRRVREAEGPR
ncbi:cysteine-rich CWC family protein [Inmirania thermothiophila]|uniref:Cysteine-rich CWC n=1 Tax=Inmirania thermothiophila TaxID=1750597 RepID=A0A3N1Y6I6_9GAMM|nr:cysteine-rich CWC family protein [Inmirania thermothiophila]ROR34423.1 hypothetical protein EDC57_0320 [Inmirania thermothiophila]